MPLNICLIIFIRLHSILSDSFSIVAFTINKEISSSRVFTVPETLVAPRILSDQIVHCESVSFHVDSVISGGSARSVLVPVRVSPGDPGGLRPSLGFQAEKVNFVVSLAFSDARGIDVQRAYNCRIGRERRKKRRRRRKERRKVSCSTGES